VEIARDEGPVTSAAGLNAHAEGALTTASGENSHAEGRLTTASGTTAHAEGTSNTAAGSYCHAEGYSNIIAVGTSSAHIEGSSNTVTGGSASPHVEGAWNTTSASYSSVGGIGAVGTRVGEWVRSDGSINNAGDNQTSLLTYKGTTSNTTMQTRFLYYGGGTTGHLNSVIIPKASMVTAYKIMVAGYSGGVTPESAAFAFDGSVYTYQGPRGTYTQIPTGTVAAGLSVKSGGASGWSASVVNEPNFDKIWRYDAGLTNWVDLTGLDDPGPGASPLQMFENAGDIIYIGMNHKFNNVYFDLSQFGDLSLSYAVSDGSGDWYTFVDAATDETSSLTANGHIYLEISDQSNWGKNTEAELGIGGGGADDLYWLRLSLSSYTSGASAFMIVPHGIYVLVDSGATATTVYWAATTFLTEVGGV